MRPRLDAATRARAVRALVVLFTALALFQLVLGDMGIVEAWKKRRATARLRLEVAERNTEIAALRADIQALNRDPFRIEAIAREQLGLARPGEIIFQFQPESAATAAAPARGD